jgi:hypothetical protein
MSAGLPVMPTVPLWRLYLLRGAYLFTAGGLALFKVPELIHHAQPWPLLSSALTCILCAVCALSALGLRYPLQMLPLMMFEIIWKGLWLFVVARPLWAAGTMDAATGEMAFACAMVIIFPIVMPWGYVFQNYVARPGDRWR